MRFRRKNQKRITLKLPPHILWGGSFLLLILAVLLFLYTWHKFFLAHSHDIPTEGGIYTEATVGRIGNLNPLSPNATPLDKDLQKLIFSGLLEFNPKTGNFESDLADLEQVDNVSYRLTLKKTAKFSDGNAVTVQDVLFTFQDLIQNPAFPNLTLKQNFEYLQIKADGERSILFTLPEQNTFFTSLLTTPILPKKKFGNFLIEEINDPDFPFNKKPIGAGPFRIKNMVPNTDGSFRVFLEKNPHYRKKVLIDQVVFYVYDNEEKLILQHSWPSVITRVDIQKLTQFQSELFEEYEQKPYILPQYTGVFFNLDQEFVKYPSLRKALRQSFIGQKLLPENWLPIEGPFFFRGMGQSALEPDFPIARKTLRDGGFPYNKEDEIRTFGKDGPAVKITLLTSTQPAFYAEIAQRIARTWEEELDIEVQLDVLPTKEFLHALEDRNYSAVLFGEDFSENFDDLSIWHASQTGKLNLSNLTRDDTDSLIADARFSGANSDFLLLNHQLEKITPAIVFASPRYALLVRKNIYDFSENLGKIRHLSQRFAHVEDWYFSTKKDWNISPGQSKWRLFFSWLFSSK